MAVILGDSELARARWSRRSKCHLPDPSGVPMDPVEVPKCKSRTIARTLLGSLLSDQWGSERVRSSRPVW